MFFCYTKHCHRIGNCDEALIIHGQINRRKRGKDNRAYFWILFDSSTTPTRNSLCNVADTPPFDCPLLLILREQKCTIKKAGDISFQTSFFFFFICWCLNKKRLFSFLIDIFGSPHAHQSSRWEESTVNRSIVLDRLSLKKSFSP